jgi:hypothetical protein
MEHILRRRCVPGLVDLVPEELHCFLADLQVSYLCFLRIPAFLLWLACLVLLPIISRTSCNLSSCVWILVSH